MRIVEFIKCEDNKEVVFVSEKNIRMDETHIYYYNQFKSKVLSSDYYDYCWSKVLDGDLRRLKEVGNTLMLVNEIGQHVYIVDIDHPKMSEYKIEFRDFKLSNLVDGLG